MQIVYSTHATSTDNVAGIASGHADPDLAPRGIEECAERAARWATRTFEVVVASDLLRARRTAELAFEDRGLPIRIDRRLRECNYGDLNGAPKSAVDTIRASRVGAPFPKGESYEDVAVRIRALLDDLAREYPRGTVLLIGHHAPYVALEHIAQGVPLADALASTTSGDYWQPEWTYRYDV
ncbi:MAG: histidine phosphatase family protein [Chloroflexi bacterium]|nr:histidine phosphatase family protein [Chloroflexota bacterium]MDA1145225.1 histidine phosphatase family protein [Chloroflexota bacterium]